MSAGRSSPGTLVSQLEGLLARTGVKVRNTRHEMPAAYLLMVVRNCLRRADAEALENTVLRSLSHRLTTPRSQGGLKTSDDACVSVGEFRGAMDDALATARGSVVWWHVDTRRVRGRAVLRSRARPELVSAGVPNESMGKGIGGSTAQQRLAMIGR